MSLPPVLEKTSSVQGIAMRVTRLNANGTAVTGLKSAYVMNRFVSVSYKSLYSGGTKIEQQTADGNFAVTYQTSDIFQHIEATVMIAGPDPEFNEIAMGGSLLLDVAGSTVGWKPTPTGQIDQPFGVALEVWSYAISGGRQAVDRPYYHWMFPRLYLHPSTGDKKLENAVLGWDADGWGNSNPAFAGTGAADWLWPTDRPYQYARVATAPININAYEVV